MKKLLGTTLALAMFVPAGANAELLKNLKTSGNLDIQTTSARNILDFATTGNQTAGGSGPGAAAQPNNDRIGHAITRVILKLDWDLLDDVHSRVTLVKGGENAAGNPRTYGTAAQTITGLEATTQIQEANVKIDKVFGALDVTAGRQFYGEEGDLIVYYGPRDAYGLRVDALDTFRADWNGEHMTVTGIAGKLADGTVVQNGPAGGTDLRGLVVSCKKHEMVKPTLYVYNRVVHAVGALGSNGSTAVGGKNSNLWVVGAKAKITTGGLTASGELAVNRGEDRSTADNTSYKGWAFLGKAAYKVDVDNVGAINPWGEFGYGTGDSNGTYGGNRNFQSINTDYRPGGIYGRFDNGAALSLANGGSNIASNGLSNRIIWGLGVKATPTAWNKLTVGAAYWRYAFNRLGDNDDGFRKSNGANGDTRNSRNIGSEIDVNAEWKHSENVTLKAGFGQFLPGRYVKDIQGANAKINPATLFSGDVNIKF